MEGVQRGGSDERKRRPEIRPGAGRMGVQASAGGRVWNKTQERSGEGFEKGFHKIRVRKSQAGRRESEDSGDVVGKARLAWSPEGWF